MPSNLNTYKKAGVKLMPITMYKPGETVTIRRITGKDSIRQHLSELGFCENTVVKIINEIAGNLILQIKDSRIAIDKNMAGRIIVNQEFAGA